MGKQAIPRAIFEGKLSLGEKIRPDFPRRTPWRGGKKRGVENLTNAAPPKTGFWTPLLRYVFHPSQVSVLCFSCTKKNPRQSRPEALLEGSKNFRESAFSGTFSSPHTFCNPPISRPNFPGDSQTVICKPCSENS